MTTPAFGPLCLRCRHLRDDFTCEAFGATIPQAIADGVFDHSEPFPGDRGIQFEPLPPGTPAREAPDEPRELSDEVIREMLRAHDAPAA